MIVIYVRCTEDWGNYSIQQFLNKHKNTNFASGVFENIVLANSFVQQIKLWNKRMDIDYFQYRASLKKIAQSTIEKYKICYNFEELCSVDDDDIICPTDDDDWFRNDLEEKLPQYIKNAECVLWDQIVHTIPVFSPHRWYNHHNDVGSNNYAIKAKFLKSLSSDTQWTILNRHDKFNKICQYYKIEKTNDLLSCYLWHIGSFTYMLENNILANHNEIKDDTLKDPEMKWAQKQTTELIKIYNNMIKSIKQVKFYL